MRRPGKPILKTILKPILSDRRLSGSAASFKRGGRTGAIPCSGDDLRRRAARLRT